MKRLFLLRHAKSVRDGSQNDRDRPLNARGRADAPRMGGYMQRKRYIPDRVLCSSAQRTAETWTMLASEFSPLPQVKFLDSLYLATAGSIVRTIRQEADDASALLVIGHNPGLEDAARDLAAEPASAQERQFLDTLENKFPTGALAVLRFDVRTWPEISEGSGTLIDFVRPKHLPD